MENFMGKNTIKAEQTDKSSNKEFLATEPVGKLLLKLSLPTVAAQIINMLYNIVDRIYIGHIPDNGALALTGVGVCMPIIMIITAFAALVGNGGAPRASIFMGRGNNDDAEKTLGNCFVTQIIICYTYNYSSAFRPQPASCIWSQRKHNLFRCRLYEHICTWNDICTAYTWHECLYISSGLC
jgi:hypothetical protein